MLGYRSAVATPIAAVAAARRRSAWRTSGRRLMSAVPSPTGMSATRRGAVTQDCSSFGASAGARPRIAASSNKAARRWPSSAGMPALTWATKACERVTSKTEFAPAS